MTDFILVLGGVASGCGAGFCRAKTPKRCSFEISGASGIKIIRISFADSRERLGRKSFGVVWPVRVVVAKGLRRFARKASYAFRSAPLCKVSLGIFFFFFFFFIALFRSAASSGSKTSSRTACEMKVRENAQLMAKMDSEQLSAFAVLHLAGRFFNCRNIFLRSINNRILYTAQCNLALRKIRNFGYLPFAGNKSLYRPAIKRIILLAVGLGECVLWRSVITVNLTGK